MDRLHARLLDARASAAQARLLVNRGKGSVALRLWAKFWALLNPKPNSAHADLRTANKHLAAVQEEVRLRLDEAVDARATELMCLDLRAVASYQQQVQALESTQSKLAALKPAVAQAHKARLALNRAIASCDSPSLQGEILPSTLSQFDATLAPQVTLQAARSLHAAHSEVHALYQLVQSSIPGFSFPSPEAITALVIALAQRPALDALTVFNRAGLDVATAACRVADTRLSTIQNILDQAVQELRQEVARIELRAETLTAPFTTAAINELPTELQPYATRPHAA